MARERLPNRHACEIAEFNHGGRSFTYQIGRYEDGRIGEVFLCGEKSGSDEEVLARDFAIIVSQLLQCGMRPADVRKSLSRNPNGSPSGYSGKLVDILAAEEKKTDAEHHVGAANL